MKLEPTSRGFLKGKFKDGNGVDCSIQESSSAEQACVWLGCDDIGLKKFVPYEGWSDVALEQNAPDGIVHIANTRMHLTQEQAAALVPMLAHFAAYGSLPQWVEKTGDRELDDLIASGGIQNAP
jgi:hypothetical protein